MKNLREILSFKRRTSRFNPALLPAVVGFQIALAGCISVAPEDRPVMATPLPQLTQEVTPVATVIPRPTATPVSIGGENFDRIKDTRVLEIAEKLVSLNRKKQNNEPIEDRELVTEDQIITFNKAINEYFLEDLFENARGSFEPQFRNGIEIYGDSKPIPKEQLPAFFQYLNSKEKDMRPDTYYGTIFVAKSTYDNFFNENGESFPSFIRRHEEALHWMMVYNSGSGVKLDRIIVTGGSDGEITLYDLRGKVKYSDGEWFIDNSYEQTSSGQWVSEPYRPFSSAYWDSGKRIDYGLLHELGHAVLHLPDQYSLDFNYEEGLKALPAPLPVLNNIPTQWQSYPASHRVDISRDLMGAGIIEDRPGGTIYTMSGIKRYTFTQLFRRLGSDIHSEKIKQEGNWLFPNEIPEVSRLLFGKQIAGAEVEVYRTYEIMEARKSHYDRKKGLEKIRVYTASENGSVTIHKDELFPPDSQQMVEAEKSTFLFKTTARNGQVYFRWADIRDWNLAFWEGFRDEVIMDMPMTSGSDTPDRFSWNIIYSRP